ncbi:PDR/VanB family oxidoreductase [Amycolatopsis stemonae]
MERETTLRMMVVDRRPLADGVVGLALASLDRVTSLPGWRPGAHIDLEPDGGPVRQYSLCGDPASADRWHVAVLRVEDGRGGSAWIHDKLETGHELRVRGPRNHFGLEPAESYQFIAGGIGITPILPMIRAAEASGADWRLAYGGRNRATMAFLPELAEYGDRVTVLPQDETGLLDLGEILGEPSDGRRVYCCGPEGLLSAVEQVMADRPGETLHLERFAPKELVGTSGEAFEVEIASSGQRVTVHEGQSILEALDEAGVQVDFSCREGTCGTCETGVLEGIPEHRDSVLTAEEQAGNDCMMICVGRCVRGPLVLDL